MASTGSVVQIRPRFTAQASGTSGSVLFFASRASTGIYSSTAITKANTRNRKVIRPVGVPIAGKDGMLNPQWEQYFAYIESTFLDMLNGPTLPDVSQFITAGQATSIAVAAIQAALSQQANANAQSIEAIREVAVSAALPGSAQIPRAKLYVETEFAGL